MFIAVNFQLKQLERRRILARFFQASTFQLLFLEIYCDEHSSLCGVKFPEPLAEASCVRLNFNISTAVKKFLVTSVRWKEGNYDGLTRFISSNCDIYKNAWFRRCHSKKMGMTVVYLLCCSLRHF